MNRKSTDSGETRMARIHREASEWVVKQRFDISPEEQDAFFDWLAADSDHAEAYTSKQRTWKHLDILSDWRPQHSLKPNPDLLDTKSSVRSRSVAKVVWLVSAIAAAIAIAIGVFNYGHRSGPKPLAEGPYAESYERYELEDGSIVELNRGAQAMVEYTSEDRRVRLARGEAYFTVAKDKERPFVVEANGLAVQAVGTMFNVSIAQKSVDVIVTEGRVMVGQPSLNEIVLTKNDVGESVQELVAGQRAILRSDESSLPPRIEVVSETEMGKRLTWLNQVLDFTDAPLSEIVLEFNRRNKRKMVIEDPSIENLAMSATISPKSIDDFVTILEVTMNIETERIDDSVIVLRAKR